jgi:putative membrane protein insertion efficiency factor
MRHLLQLPALLAITFIRLYKALISPIIHVLLPHHGCRFHPTCSAYGIEALQTHGFLKGMLLLIWRLFRCQPWGGSGEDPVPQKDAFRLPQFK